MPRSATPVDQPPSSDPGRYYPLYALGAFLFPGVPYASARNRMLKFANPHFVNGVAVRMRVRHLGPLMEARLIDWEDYQRQCDEAKFGSAVPPASPAKPPRLAERLARESAEALIACGVDPESAKAVGSTVDQTTAGACRPRWSRVVASRTKPEHDRIKALIACGVDPRSVRP